MIRATERTLTGGVDLGGTKIEAVVVDEAHAVIGQARRTTPTRGGPTSVAAEIIEALGEAAASAQVEPGSLAGVGVAAPGVVDPVAGTVARAGNLPDWTEPFPLASTLTRALGPPVYLGNDVGAAVDAEIALGAGRHFSSFLAVWWGTGVGGAVGLEGRRWRGRGASGEIGHTVVVLGGAHCPCGRRGCLEAYAGRAAMEARARRLHKRGAKTSLFALMEESGRTRLTSGVWERALAAGDPLAERLIARAVRALGAGIASAVNLMDVEGVILGGGLGTRLGQPYLDRIGEAMQPHLFVPDRPPSLRLAELGDLGGALGAALLAAPGVGLREGTPGCARLEGEP